jgi:hypothetical protein
MRYEGNHVVLTESELHNLVNESVKIYLRENSEDEIGNPLDYVRNKGRQMKAAVSSLTGGKKDSAGNSPTLRKRITNARKNWSTQGQLNDLNDAIEILYKYVNNGDINPNLTVAQLFGTKGKNGKMGQYLGNLSSQITRRGGKGYNARNKQNLPQQPQQ